MGGFFLPWSPYLYVLIKYPSQGTQMFEHKTSSYSFLYDHVDSSLYNQEVLNTHNFWYLLVSYTRSPKKTNQFFDKLQVPLLVLFGWSFLVNSMIILITRGNNKMSSHKKHLLQQLSLRKILLSFELLISFRLIFYNDSRYKYTYLI